MLRDRLLNRRWVLAGLAVALGSAWLPAAQSASAATGATDADCAAGSHADPSATASPASTHLLLSNRSRSIVSSCKQS